MPLALPRRRALPGATLKSNKAGACSRFVKEKKKKNKNKKKKRKERKRREERSEGPASREHVKVLPRSAGAKEGKKEEGKRGKDERGRELKRKRTSGIGREERREGLDVVETTKPKRRIGER